MLSENEYKHFMQLLSRCTLFGWLSIVGILAAIAVLILEVIVGIHQLGDGTGTGLITISLCFSLFTFLYNQFLSWKLRRLRREFDLRLTPERDSYPYPQQSKSIVRLGEDDELTDIDELPKAKRKRGSAY